MDPQAAVNALNHPWWAPGAVPEGMDPQQVAQVLGDPTLSQPRTAVDLTPRSPELSPYSPSFHERVAQGLFGEHMPSPAHRRFGEGVANLLDFTPIGQAASAVEAAKRGDYQGAAIAAMPGMPAAKLAKPAAKLATSAAETILAKEIPHAQAPAAAEASIHAFPEQAVNARGEAARALRGTEGAADPASAFSPSGAYERTGGGGAGPIRRLDQAPVAETYTLPTAKAEALTARGIAAPNFHELEPTVGADTFHKAIGEAKTANQSGAAVTQYDPADYQGSRLFLTPDSKAGFAIKPDGDIVSVFKHPDANMKGFTVPMLDLAVANGGRKLDAFDTVLPHLYGDSGFKAVARLPWNEEYKPQGWDKSRFAAFNKGEPDVVFMVNDPTHGEPYKPGDGPMVGSYDEAVAAQNKELAKLYPTARAPVTPEGLPIQGKEYSKASTKVLSELAQEPKGTGPLDLKSAEGPGTAPQVAMERYEPPRGVSPRLGDALKSNSVLSGMRDSIRKGMEMGAHKWYHTEPIRQAFISELGDEKGPAAFQKYMDLVAATSPRSDVPTNIRNASFYHSLGDQPIPEKLPYPYGHVAQNLHRQNVEGLANAEPGKSGWNIFKNPKPASFSANLTGNQLPVTVDTHAFRNIGMRTGDPRFLETSLTQKFKASDPGEASMAKKYGEINGDKVTFRPQQLVKDGKLTMKEAQNIPTFWSSKPNENEYKAAEEIYTKLAKEFNISPAEAQAAAWAGGGELTGLGTTPDKTFPELFNNRVEYTARMRGEVPRDTLKWLIRGKKPLLGLGGAAAVGAASQDNR